MLRFHKIPKVIQALSVQFLSLLLLAIAVWLAAHWFDPPFSDCVLLSGQVLLAVLISFWLRMPSWWLVFQAFLPVLLYLAIASGMNPLLGLVAFIVIWLLFRNALLERVPLYLTNLTSRKALLQLAEELESRAFIDLGCGFAHNVSYLDDKLVRSVGVETAPLSWMIAKVNAFLNGGEVYFQDIWKTDLQDFDLVYAFLSPQPMEKLWQKLLQELDENAVFVSNSFAVPNVEPSEIWSLNDTRQTQFYIYRMADFTIDGTSSNQPIKEIV